MFVRLVHRLSFPLRSGGGYAISGGDGKKKQNARCLTDLEVSDSMASVQKGRRRTHEDDRGVEVFISFPRVLSVELVEV